MAAVRFSTPLGTIKYRIDLQRSSSFLTLLTLLYRISHLPITSHLSLFVYLSYLYLTRVLYHPTLLFYSHAFHYKSISLFLFLFLFPPHFLHLSILFATLACLFFHQTTSCYCFSLPRRTSKETSCAVTQDPFPQDYLTGAHVLKTSNKLCTCRRKEHLLPYSSRIRLWHDGRDPTSPGCCSYITTPTCNASSLSPSSASNPPGTFVCAAVASGTTSVLRSPNQALPSVRAAVTTRTAINAGL